MSSKPNKKRQHAEESIEAKARSSSIEPTTFKNEAKVLAKDTVSTMWDELLGGSAGSLSEQILGGGETHDMQEGQEVSLKKAHAAKEEAEKAVAVSSEHMEYFRTVNNADRVSESHVEVQMKQSVDQIRMEIQRLIKTSKVVEMTVKDATADQAPIKPGKYHINFFEFVLSVIRDATQKLEDTANFGAVFTSKKQQSKYWTSFKKHGTSFGLSGERTTATQTG